MPAKPKSRPKPVRKSKPRWDLYRHGLTQGAIHTFLSCPHQFWLKYVQGWRPRVCSAAIEFGSAFHDILGRIHLGEKSRKAVESVRKGCITSRMTVKEREEMEVLLATAAVTVEGYLEHWADHDSEIEWVCREEAFRFEFSPFMGCQPVPLRGRWDGLFYRPWVKVLKTNRPIHVFETKTKQYIDQNAIQDIQSTDLQTMLYSLAAESEKRAPVGGVLYDVVRRTSVKQGSLPIGEYAKKVRAAIDKDPGWYYMRWRTDLAKTDLPNWVSRVLRPIVRSIVFWWDSVKDLEDPFDSPSHFLNPDALVGRYGNCDLFDLIVRGDKTGLVQVSEPYPELLD